MFKVGTHYNLFLAIQPSLILGNISMCFSENLVRIHVTKI